jgi:outer membrane protein assembly factor BamB
VAKTYWVHLALCLGTLASPGRAADWPQWRGPHRDGVSGETGLLRQWPQNGPKLLWQIGNLGPGYSTPSVVGERVYVQSNTDMDNEIVLALDARTGKQLWSTRLGRVGINQGPQYPGARSTPTVDGDLLFALGSDGDLACLETATGKVIWQKNLRREFDGRPGMWAYAESPLIDGDVLVCTPGGKRVSLLALHKNTGDVIWKSLVPKAGDAAYASAGVVQVDGVKQYVQVLEKVVVGVDARNGRLLWRYDETTKSSPANIPTPVTHDRYVYTATGFGGAGLVKLKASADGIEAVPVYYNFKLPNAIGGALLVGDYLYGTTNRSGLMCVAFTTGKVIWQDKCLGPGSVSYADGCLYVHGEGTGSVVLVEATPEGYHERGRFTPPGQPDYTKDTTGTKAWEYPVVANGRLYLRNLGSLWCYDIKALQ